MPIGMNTSQFEVLLHKSIDKAYMLWDSDGYVSEGDKLIGGNVITSKQGFYIMQQTTRPNAPSVVKEREALPEVQYGLAATKTYSVTKYAELLTWSAEVWDDIQYPEELFGRWAEDLRALHHDVRDWFLVNQHFNLADTNLGPDGQAYLSASHPLEPEAAEFMPGGVTVQSNLIPGNPTISVSALNAGAVMLKRTRDSKGQIMSILPPMYIECDASQEVLWNAIAFPVNGFQPFTSDRNTGKDYAKLIAGVIGLARSVHSQRFILRTSNSRKQGRFVWDRKKPTISEVEYVKQNDTRIASSIARFTSDIMDYRGQVGSLAGS